MSAERLGEADAPRARRTYEFIDFATQGYLAAAGLLILFFHGRGLPGWPWLLAGHAVAMAAVHCLLVAYRARPCNRFLNFVRHFYPILLYTPFYRETSLLNLLFVHHYLDPAFLRFEERLFRCQPSVAFMNALPYRAVSELFYLSYFSYYVMIAGVGLALYFRKRTAFFHYVSVVSFVFYVCYLTYIFLPVLGPPAFFIPLDNYPAQASLPYFPLAFPESVKGGTFFMIMKFVYAEFDGPGAAFPSSHVAVAICTLCFSWRYLKPIRYAHLVVVVLLSVSTVYCRFHYVIDVLAGAATACVLIPLAEFLYAKSRHLT